ncbi:uncharacterized protein [Palaemon carinicauda]|uniref:uncharacterized protein n=1 Tax=Palaemon carinicauda TaxID=392227 RepID=UPI0035B5DEF5
MPEHTLKQENSYPRQLRTLLFMTTGSVYAVSDSANFNLFQKVNQLAMEETDLQNHRSVSSKDLLTILWTIDDIGDRNLQFLHSPAYEDTLEKAMKPLSNMFIASKVIENDRRADKLKQILYSSTDKSILVVMESPREVIKIFKTMKDHMLKCQLSNWLLIMEGEEAESSLGHLEDLVAEGTQILVFTKDPQTEWNLFLSKIDLAGITRFTRLEGSVGGHRIKDFGVRHHRQHYDFLGRMMTVGVKQSTIALQIGQTYPDGSVELVSGVDTILLKTYSSVLNFTYKAFVPRDNIWGNPQPNGSVTGIIGMVARREVTLGMSALAITESRMKVIDFTFPHFSSGLLLISRYPKVKSRALAVLSPFPQEVWFSICAAVLLIGPVIYAVSNLPTDHQKRDAKYSFQRCAFNMFRSFVIQGNFIRGRRWSQRWILFCWYIFCLIFYALYSGMLTAVLAIPTYETPIDSLQDLPRAIKEGFTLSIAKGTSYEHYFKTATEGIIKETWKLFNHEEPSKSFVDNSWEGITRNDGHTLERRPQFRIFPFSTGSGRHATKAPEVPS